MPEPEAILFTYSTWFLLDFFCEAETEYLSGLLGGFIVLLVWFYRKEFAVSTSSLFKRIPAACPEEGCPPVVLTSLGR